MKNYKVIGLMSGTSLDGLDIAYCHFSKSEKDWKFRIEAAETIEYTKEKKLSFEKIYTANGLELTKANADFGVFMGKEVRKFIKKNNLRPDFISSHGHTIFHQPEQGFTLQIGSGASLSAIAELPVVNDFRSLDVSLKGQGAPLVPIGDHLLFNEYSMCLNLGGIANISFAQNRKRIAFDICPVNIILNSLAKLKGLEYDKDGKLAREGNVNEALLVSLNKLAFYKKSFPKSLGKEWIEKNIFPLINKSTISIEDKLCTVCHHIAHQIVLIVNNYALKNKNKLNHSLLITGGGALNKFLIELITDYVNPKTKVVVPDMKTVMFKEALIFAFLGVLRVRNEANCLRSVTGAEFDNIGGALYGNFKNLIP